MTTSNQFVRNAFLHSMKSEMLITILRQVFDFSTDQDFLVQIKHNFRWWGRVRSRRGRRRPRKNPKTERYYSPKWSFFWWFAVEWLRLDPFSSPSRPLSPLVHKNIRQIPFTFRRIDGYWSAVGRTRNYQWSVSSWLICMLVILVTVRSLSLMNWWVEFHWSSGL